MVGRNAKQREFETTWAETREKFFRRLRAHGISAADADDILQDASVRALAKLDQCHSDILEPWLWRITAHFAAEVMRRKHRHFLRGKEYWDTVAEPRKHPLWNNEAEPVRWLTPSVLALVLPPKLASFAEEALDSDFDVERIAKRGRQAEHRVRREMQRLKQHLIADVGCAFAFNLHLNRDQPPDLVRVKAFICRMLAAYASNAISYPITAKMFRVEDFLEFNDHPDPELRRAKAMLDHFNASLNSPLLNYLHALVLSEMSMIDESFCLALSEIGNLAILLDACIKEGTFTNPEGLITASVRDYQDNLPRFHDHIERLRKKLKKRP